MHAIEIQGLSKRYKDVTAVDGVTLAIEKGELFTLLGVNGAGKSTLIKMLSCLTAPTAGEAYIQTMTPSHKVITLAAKQDYDSFYEMELQLRQLQNCPPFGDVALVTFSALDEAAVLRGSTKFAQSLLSCLRQPEYAGESCTVLGPAPCVVAKINYNYRYRLTLRCRMTPKLRQLLAHILRQFAQDRENRGISAYVDVNGFE